MHAFNTMWASVEFIACIKQYSCSRLAIQGGLDATAFNKSKRHTPYGQPRWLSIGTLIRTLDGVQMDLLDFAVIYQVLYHTPNNIPPTQMQDIMTAVHALVREQMERMGYTFRMENSQPQ